MKRHMKQHEKKHPENNLHTSKRAIEDPLPQPPPKKARGPEPPKEIQHAPPFLLLMVPVKNQPFRKG